MKNPDLVYKKGHCRGLYRSDRNLIMKDVSRRSFLKLAVLAGAAMAVKKKKGGAPKSAVPNRIK
jgi:hypothetical protein